MPELTPEVLEEALDVLSVMKVAHSIPSARRALATWAAAHPNRVAIVCSRVSGPAIHYFLETAETEE